MSESKNVKAIFDASMMGRDGEPSSSSAKRCVKVFPPEGYSSWGQHQFVKRSDLESLYVTDGGRAAIMCVVTVARDDEPLDVPPSDIGRHLGALLDSADGSDVSFIVDGEEFPAHRVVLAARSPVFKAQLLGNMADAKIPSISLHDITPTTFKTMLRFIYTDDLLEDEDEDKDEDKEKDRDSHRDEDGDEDKDKDKDNDNDEDEDENDEDEDEDDEYDSGLDDDEYDPGSGDYERGLGGPATKKLQDLIADKDDDELGGSATKKLQDLLAAADRYALDRLKLLCARKLLENISVDTVASTLACAGMYNCQELKKRCIDFFADENNFKKAVLTDDFAQLVLKFPSILAELRVKVRV
ncbi:BTB/POZ and MATH domain-containing protein 1-like [Panicum miliaceum]|uniref:BTB/POZ and MATH domain-containing protein 1-like n=1 Tax=Panicum miliaceum TaxID=4540 RepID=A0A3L6RHD3_PANMI|nr:BTB/POZ and MATH domain-containing protein 1-like [Panicum miliaceum]